MAMEPPLTLRSSSGHAELPLDDQRYAGEGLIDLEQADVTGAEADGLQGLAPGETAAGDEQGGCADLGGIHRCGYAASREDGQPGGSERPGQVDRGRGDSHVPKQGWHAGLHLTVQSYSL
jgi:hypothetical protein